MAFKHKRYKRMYAVSREGVGLIAGTLAYSRREAIRHFLGGYVVPAEWNEHKTQGCRTVQAMVKVVEKPTVVR